jgi:hypothetical protein
MEMKIACRCAALPKTTDHLYEALELVVASRAFTEVLTKSVGLEYIVAILN